MTLFTLNICGEFIMPAADSISNRTSLSRATPDPRHVSRSSISRALSSFPKRTAVQCISCVEWERSTLCRISVAGCGLVSSLAVYYGNKVCFFFSFFAFSYRFLRVLWLLVKLKSLLAEKPVEVGSFRISTPAVSLAPVHDRKRQRSNENLVTIQLIHFWTFNHIRQ